MNESQILALYDQDQRREIEYPDMLREVTPTVVRLVDKAGGGEGAIIHSDLDGANAGDAIRDQVRYFQSVGQDFEWKVYDYDRPSDLKERLASFGFTVGDAEAIMVLDLEDAPEVLHKPVAHDVRRITDPERLAGVQTVKQEVWDEDASGTVRFLGGAIGDYPDQMHVYVVYVDGQPASAGWIFFPEHSQFASLWGGATIPRFRKRGLYTALVAVRAQDAIARQVRYLTVDAMPMSRPILEKLGFERIAYSYPCKWRLASHAREGP